MLVEVDVMNSRVILGAFPAAVPFHERMGMSAVGRKAGTGVLKGRTWALMEKELADRVG